MSAQWMTDPRLSIELLLDLFIQRVDALKRGDLQQLMLFEGIRADSLSSLIRRCERLHLLERSIQNVVPHGLHTTLTAAGTAKDRKLANRIMLHELRHEQNRSIAKPTEVIWLGPKGASLAGVPYLKYGFEELNAALRLSCVFMRYMEDGNSRECWRRSRSQFRFGETARTAFAKVADLTRFKTIVAPILSSKFNRKTFNIACRRLEDEFEIC